MLQKKASTDDKTIMKVSRNEIQKVSAPRRKRKPVVKKVLESYSHKVDKRVMRVARVLADGDMRRVIPVDATTAIVLNNPPRGRK